MKLLPYIIPFVKDAARSVKRICQADFKEVVDETLTESEHCDVGGKDVRVNKHVNSPLLPRSV